MTQSSGDRSGGGRAELAAYVETWWLAVQDFAALLEEVPESQWGTPTDLPGWDVRACASHTAHLESVLAGRGEETAEVGEPPHVTGLMGLYTEIGVLNRRDASAAAIIEELRAVTTERHHQLLADPPTDPSAVPQVTFGGLGWGWRQLLRNRPLDIWMHSQDVRRAVVRPGGMDTAAARHTAEYLAEGLGYVLAKKVGALIGTTVVLEMEGSATCAFGIDENGRGQRLREPPTKPTLTVRLDRESLVLLAGGRRRPDPGRVRLEGDEALGRTLIERMATTP